jgi:hypothetical protein
MIERISGAARRHEFGAGRIAGAGVLLVALLCGCDGRGEAASASKAATQPAEPAAESRRRLPTLTFPTRLRTQYPEVGAFLDEFLNTCLVGDYVGYRRLVSRAHTPESRERFAAIYEATQAVTVETIEPIDVPQVSPPVYRVVATVALSPQQQARLRETNRKVAILVFKEGEDWRMAPAPARLQPHEPPPPTTTSAPAASAPSYPWDEEGDY